MQTKQSAANRYAAFIYFSIIIYNLYVISILQHLSANNNTIPHLNYICVTLYYINYINIHI